MITFSDEEKRECLKRELALRKRLYPRWVLQNRMSQEEADRQIGILEEIAQDYKSKGELAL